MMYKRLPSLAGLRLLVVDDDPDTRELLTILFKEYEAKTIAVACVSEAIAAIEHLRPDILISDIRMPAEDGYSLIRQVRNLNAKRGGQIPAIALSAYAGEEDRVRALSAGFQEYVTKPIDIDQFAAMVAAYAVPLATLAA